MARSHLQRVVSYFTQCSRQTLLKRLPGRNRPDYLSGVTRLGSNRKHR